MKLLLLALLLQNPADQCDERAVRQARDRATSCVEREATRMARSRDRAEAVAIAAISRCEGALLTTRQAVARCEGYQGGRTFDRIFRARLRNSAIGTVVSARTR